MGFLFCWEIIHFQYRGLGSKKKRIFGLWFSLGKQTLHGVDEIVGDEIKTPSLVGFCFVKPFFFLEFSFNAF